MTATMLIHLRANFAQTIHCVQVCRWRQTSSGARTPLLAQPLLVHASRVELYSAIRPGRTVTRPDDLTPCTDADPCRRSAHSGARPSDP